MKGIKRYDTYKEENFDKIIMMIRKGEIKAGKYSHLVKVDKNKIIKDKELFANGKDDN